MTAMPCPHLACKQHLWVVDRTDRPGNPHRDLGQDRRRTIVVVASQTSCALQVVAAHPDGAPLDVIAQAFGVAPERIRQIETKALAKLEAAARALGIDVEKIAKLKKPKRIGSGRKRRPTPP
ncbi:MAG: hypothetical protein M3619_04555 [Myxococcota bacterium]|nr:hypothetical protein [Myxococcota bacterium]